VTEQYSNFDSVCIA